MGILNVTPDSFSDGGRYLDVDAAVAHGRRLFDEGAAMVDVGAESTRPGAAPVAPEEQLRRALPVVERLVPHGPVSIDTTSATVARAALAAGASIVNDVSAGLDDPELLPAAAAAGAAVALMHRRVAPAQDRYSDQYDRPPDSRDILAEVGTFLRERVLAAMAAGIPAAAIAVDPGLGFGKSVAQNYRLLARLDALAQLHPVVLVGASRKSFIAAATGRDSTVVPPSERLPGSLAAAVLAAMRGAAILRVHDVAATAQALAVARATLAAEAPPA